MKLLRCYALAVPLLVWAVLLLLGLDADDSRVAFLFAEVVAVGVYVDYINRRLRGKL